LNAQIKGGHDCSKIHNRLNTPLFRYFNQGLLQEFEDRFEQKPTTDCAQDNKACTPNKSISQFSQMACEAHLPLRVFPPQH
jgi:hypothetical protein